MIVWRHYFMLSLLLLGSVAIAARVAWLAFLEKDFLQGQGDARSLRTEIVPSYRGVIHDRYGEPLAVSTPVVAVWTDPSRQRLAEADLQRLAPRLGIGADRLAALIDANREKSFVYLKRRVPWATAEQIRKLRIEGLDFQREYRRYYPAGETAAHVVGMTNIDDIGLEGIELSFDHLLRGKHGRKLVLKDRLGNIIRDLDFQSAPRMGQDLALSIDLRLQYAAYRELKNAVAWHRARSGSLVILDVRTGEILALVNQPSYNPNEPLTGPLSGMRNRAATDLYEPGSTVKPFAVIAALESGQYRPDTIIDTSPGYIGIRGKLIEDPLNRGRISLARALHKSSQVGFAKVALALPPRAVYEVLRRAGAGDFVGSGLPGESVGHLDPAGLEHPVARATLAFGYGLTLSPLQLAQAYLTVASGGVRIPISALKLDSPPGGRRVFEAHTAHTVLNLMEGVTSREGTAPAAHIPGYRVAGKTGTTRIVNEDGYSKKRHVALFVGVAPLHDPRLLMVVVVNDAGGSRIGGGAVAAPVFARVAERALRLMDVPPEGEQVAVASTAGPSNTGVREPTMKQSPVAPGART